MQIQVAGSSKGLCGNVEDITGAVLVGLPGKGQWCQRALAPHKAWSPRSSNTGSVHPTLGVTSWTRDTLDGNCLTPGEGHLGHSRGC